MSGMKTTARMSKATSKVEGHEIVMIHADRKGDAQEAIKVAKAWLRETGARFKLVYFHCVIGSEWSSMGRRYVARIAYKPAAA